MNTAAWVILGVVVWFAIDGLLLLAFVHAVNRSHRRFAAETHAERQAAAVQRRRAHR